MSQRTASPCGLFSRAKHKVKLSNDEILLDTPFIRNYDACNNNCHLNGGHRDSCFKRSESRKRSSWRLACSVPSRRLRVLRAVSTSARRSNQQFLVVDGSASQPLTNVCTRRSGGGLFSWAFWDGPQGRGYSGAAERRLARPRFPAFTDGLRVLLYVHFFPLFNAVSHDIFRFFAGRFEQRPEKWQRKNAPVEFPPRRLQFDFPFALARGGVADGQANGDSKPKCAENSRHRIFAHEIFATLSARFAFSFVWSQVWLICVETSSFARRNCSRPVGPTSSSRG